MENISILIDFGQGESSVSKFIPFKKPESLPFPLNQSTEVKFIIATYLVLIFTSGLKLRLKILKFLKMSDVKKNPINYFIWNDQVTKIKFSRSIALLCIGILTLAIFTQTSSSI